MVVVVVMERYETLKDIGSGNFGVAKLVKDKSCNELFAVKFIDRGQKVFLSFFLLLMILSFIYRFCYICKFRFHRLMNMLKERF